MMTDYSDDVTDDDEKNHDNDHDDHLSNGCKKLLNGSNFPGRQSGVEVPRVEEINLSRKKMEQFDFPMELHKRAFYS